MNAVEKISKYWNKLRYWQKGGVIGFLIGSVPLISILVPLHGLLFFLSPFVKLIEFKFGIYLFINLFVAIVLGFLFGFILDKIVKKYKNLTQFSNTKKFAFTTFLILVIFFLFTNLVGTTLLAYGASYNAIMTGLLSFFKYSLLIINAYLIPFVLLVGLISTTLGLLLDLLKKFKMYNLVTWVSYLFIWFLFIYIQYSVLLTFSAVIMFRVFVTG